MKWIYLSPHLDDAVLSAGGLIWEQTQQGQAVEIWTIFAGDPPPGPLSSLAVELHARWQTGREAVATRRGEDMEACQILGARYRHLDIPDCIYRHSPKSGLPIVRENDDLFCSIHPEEQQLVTHIAHNIATHGYPEDHLVSPLSMGGHMDHRIVRAAAQQTRKKLFYYADYPYAIQKNINAAEWIQTDWEEISMPVSARGLKIWQTAISAYRSQISTFWPDDESMRSALRDYMKLSGGTRLWKTT